MKYEATNINEVRLEASKLGAILWRNNTGAAKDITGRIIRYGLANESKRMNEEVKSSDLIGMTAEGKFLAIEVKREGWVYSGTPREKAQQRFLRLVNKQGGTAFFCSNAAHVAGFMEVKIK